MTTVNPAIRIWAGSPVGKATRIAVAAIGMATATVILMTAAVVTNGTWALVLLGVMQAAVSVRAALAPTAARLAFVATALATLPFIVNLA